MILFGAGSSIPLGIPGMEEFTQQFISMNEEMSGFMINIKESISKTEETIGVSFPFDLESLLCVLNDLAGVTPKKPISIMTASLLLEQNLNIKAAREKYQNEAIPAFEKLKEFVFSKCMQPIKDGRKKGNFRFLNRFYGPLMTVLNLTNIDNIQDPIRQVYSTNWDLCFKVWVDYINIPIDDRIVLDKQGFPVLNVEKQTISIGFNYVPLHGSLDLVKTRRLKGAGDYQDVFKVSDPIGYFEDKPSNIKDVFLIYPLEAIGYEESVKSPYLDMLNSFRSSLEKESVVFIIGYSLRDPTIGSIFEEVIAKRIRNGDLNPLSENLDSRKSEVSKDRLKIVVINPKPEKLIENLRKQLNTNLLQTFVPIKLEFPEVADEQFSEKYSEVLSQLIADLVDIDYLKTGIQAESLVNILNQTYDSGIRTSPYPWKRD